MAVLKKKPSEWKQATVDEIYTRLRPSVLSDIPSPLSSDITEALENANAPAPDNPFATQVDLASVVSGFPDEPNPNIVYIAEDFDFATISSGYADRVLEIRYVHDLGDANIQVPENCTLLFKGGKFINVGNLVGNNSHIQNPENQQCFETTISFTGTWSETTCNYQWFGAKSNVSLTDYTNDSADAINKAHNSPFKVKPIPGFYYIASTLIYSVCKYLDFGISNAFHEDDVNSMPSAQVIPSQVCFYTDKDIDIWDLRVSGIHIFGGQINVAGVGTYTKDAIKIKAETAKIIDGSILKTKIVGSLVGNAAQGADGKAFHWDTTDNTKYGCLSSIKVDIHVLFIPYGIVIDSEEGAFTTTWQGVSWFNFILDGCKQALKIEGGFHNYFSGYIQNRAVLALSETNMYQAEIKSGILDLFNWDLAPGKEEPVGSGRYYSGRHLSAVKAESHFIV